MIQSFALINTLSNVSSVDRDSKFCFFLYALISFTLVVGKRKMEIPLDPQVQYCLLVITFRFALRRIFNEMFFYLTIMYAETLNWKLYTVCE